MREFFQSFDVDKRFIKDIKNCNKNIGEDRVKKEVEVSVICYEIFPHIICLWNAVKRDYGVI